MNARIVLRVMIGILAIPAVGLGFLHIWTPFDAVQEFGLSVELREIPSFAGVVQVFGWEQFFVGLISFAVCFLGSDLLVGVFGLIVGIHHIPWAFWNRRMCESGMFRAGFCRAIPLFIGVSLIHVALGVWSIREVAAKERKALSECQAQEGNSEEIQKDE